jgi:predicted CxxxxCH...CXXCH cytochrome family protein
MAYQMNNFPMMLQFNRTIFLSEAGQVIGTPTPGPQSAATYPGVAKAINSGMGSMAIDMGYAPPGTDPIVAGQAMWSGQFFGMWVPPNMDPSSPFMGEINSFITMSHGIKGATALNSIAAQKYNSNICSSCHYTGAEYAAGVPLNKRIDFAKLGYPSQGTITDPFFSPGNCINCHPVASLLASGAHAKHITAAPRFYNMTGNHSVAGAYDFGCSNCHPVDLANHNNGVLNVTLNKVNTGLGGNVGRLRALNSATVDGLAATNGPSGVFGTSRLSVKCSASYCHSNGYAANLQYAVSPDWYGPAYTGDKCAMCHGNAPNNGGKVGSAAHTAHQVGIHATTVFNGKSGFLPTASLTRQNAAHGYGWSTTISCNTCHNDTVTTGFNAANQSCSTTNCHGSGGVYTTNYATIANTALHVNGTADLKFVNASVRSKAQLRNGSFDSYTAATEGGWSRNQGYKNYSTSFDVTKKSLQAGTIWSKDGTTTTCTTACHANKQVLWNTLTIDCTSCHTRL